MAVPRKTLGCVTVATVLAFTEYAVITIAVQPLSSTRNDWILACGCIAPTLTAFLLWLGVTTARIIADVLALLRHIGQWITRTPKHLPRPAADPIPSSSTPSAAPPSSSCGWPSAGSSSTSHRGNKGIPWP